MQGQAHATLAIKAFCACSSSISEHGHTCSRHCLTAGQTLLSYYTRRAPLLPRLPSVPGYQSYDMYLPARHYEISRRSMQSLKRDRSGLQELGSLLIRFP